MIKYKNNINLISKTAVFVFFALVCVYSTMYREPWRDETQAWLIARDCGIFELFGQMTYEGHPALWQLVLFPFAHMGLPFWFIYVINTVLYFGVLYLVLFKLNLKLWQSIALFCTCPMVVYSYQARSYMLLFFMLMLCACIYDKRKSMPVIFGVCVALLANVHAHAIGAAGALFLCCLIDFFEDKAWRSKNKSHTILSLIIMGAGFIVFLLQVVPSLGKNGYVDISQNEDVLKKLSENIFVTFGEKMVSVGVFLILAVILIFAAVSMLSIKRFVVFAGSVLFPLVFYLFVYSNHCESLFVFMFFCMVIMKKEPIGERFGKSKISENLTKKLSYILCVLLLCSTGHSYLYLERNNDKTSLTSGSIQAADFLNMGENLDAVLVGEYPPQVSTICAMIDKERKVWYSYQQDFGTYVTWSEELKISQQQMNLTKLQADIRENFTPDEKIFVILSRDFPIDEDNESIFKKVFETENCETDEAFKIFEFAWI